MAERRNRRAGARGSRRLGASLAMVAALCGCGWRAGLEEPSGAQTLAVAYLDNQTRLPDLEIFLTEAISEAALERLNLVPAKPSEADLLVQGRIVDYSRRGGIRSPENELLETATAIVLETELVRASDGRVLARSRRRLEAGFVIETGFSAQRTAGELVARERVTRNLATGTVLDLFGGSDREPEPLPEEPASPQDGLQEAQ